MNRALATSTCVLLMTLLLVVAVSGYHQPTLVTIANQTNGFNFPNVQLASTTVYEGKYYAIQDMTNELIEVDPETLNMTLSIQIPSLYTSYTMGGAARIMLTPNLVVVSTRVIGGMSGNVGWTAGFNRFTFDQVWNISMLACMGDVPTFTVVGDNIFFTANNFTNFSDLTPHRVNKLYFYFGGAN